MPIIKTKEDWWGVVYTHWDEILFMFQYYVELDRPGGLSLLNILIELKETKAEGFHELLDILQGHMEEDETVLNNLPLGAAQDIILELVEQCDVLYKVDRVRKEKGRGNKVEGLGKNEGLEGKIARFRKIMVSGWSKGIIDDRVR